MNDAARLAAWASNPTQTANPAGRQQSGRPGLAPHYLRRALVISVPSGVTCRETLKKLTACAIAA